jgi:hypothetical protein
MSLREVVSIYGLLASCAQVSLTPLADFYTLLKFLRRRAHSQCPLDAPARFWPCLGNIFAIWAEREYASSPRTIMPESRATARSTVFTDASESINVLEALAILRALHYLKQQDVVESQDYRYDFRVDNTTAIAVVLATCSRSVELNNVVHDIAHHPCFPRIQSMTYVTSAANKADWLSRAGWLTLAPATGDTFSATPNALQAAILESVLH